MVNICGLETLYTAASEALWDGDAIMHFPLSLKMFLASREMVVSNLTFAKHYIGSTGPLKGN